MTAVHQEASGSAEQVGDGNSFSQVQNDQRIRFDIRLDGTEVAQLITIGAVHIHVSLDVGRKEP
jgi:hypothetical protein